MILSAQSILALGDKLIDPFMYKQHISSSGLSYGLGPCGYDIRVDQALTMCPGDFRLASSIEHFCIPDYLLMRVVDKSSWARQGIAVQNTVGEPGWKGYLTLEITNHSRETITIQQGDPIAQVIFDKLDTPTLMPYRGKYQDQKRGPQPFIKQLDEQ
jgi:dCTP deaminase